MKKARKDNKGRALKLGEYQRSDMTYAYHYTDPFGKRRFIYANTLQELRKKEDGLLKNQLDGLKDYSKGESTVNFLVDRYLHMKTNLRASTLTNYKYMYDHFVRDGFGKKKLTEVKYSDVLYFYNYLVTEKGMKITTLDNIHCVLHPAFQLAVRDNLIRRNPSDGAMAAAKSGRSHPKTTRHALTLEQQRAFMNYMAGNPFFVNWLDLFTVMLGTGCRVGEICGLRWEDVNFKEKMISINHGLVYYLAGEESINRKCGFSVSLPKTEAGIRTIPMLPQVEQALRNIKEDNKMKPKPEEIDGMGNFIFIASTGRVLTPRQINDAIDRIVKNYNKEETQKAVKENREPLLLPHFSCHQLRHTFCTRFCENETNVKVIQSIMGHAEIATTMDIYTEVTEAKKADVMMRLAMAVDVF